MSESDFATVGSILRSVEEQASRRESCGKCRRRLVLAKRRARSQLCEEKQTVNVIGGSLVENRFQKRQLRKGETEASIQSNVSRSTSDDDEPIGKTINESDSDDSEHDKSPVFYTLEEQGLSKGGITHRGSRMGEKAGKEAQVEEQHPPYYHEMFEMETRKEKIQLGDSQKRLRKRELLMEVLTCLAEFLDTTYDLVSYSIFTAFNTKQDVLFRLYTVVTVGGTIASVLMVRARWRNICTLRRELREGVEVTKLRQGQQEGKEHRQIDAFSKADNHPEVIIERLRREQRLLKANLVVAFLEDFLVLYLAGYRLFFTKEAWFEDYATCIELPDKVPAGCMSQQQVFLFFQLFFSLGMFVFRFSYVRDIWRIQSLIRDTAMELINLATRSESILDSFEKVLEDEVNAVVAMRNLLGSSIEDLPADIAGDVKLLRFLRNSQGDIFSACIKFREYLAQRKADKMDLLRENILRNDLALDESAFAKYMKDVFQVNFWLGRNQLNGNPVYFAYLHPDFIKTEELAKSVSLTNYRAYLLHVFQWLDLVLDHLSRKEHRLIRYEGIMLSDNSTHLSDAVRVGRYLTVIHKLENDLFPGTFQTMHFLGRKNIASSINQILKPLWPKGTVEKYRLYPSGIIGENQLKQHFSEDVIPLLLRGTATVISRDGQVDPTCLNAEVRYQRISAFLGPFSILQLFKGVSAEEIETVSMLEEKCGTKSFPDDVMGAVRVLRFLRENRHDQSATEKAIRSSLRWRQESKIDKIREEILTFDWSWDDLPNHAQLFQYVKENPFLCRSKQGSIVRLLYWSKSDFRKLAQEYSVEKYLRVLFYRLEFYNIVLDRLSRQEHRVVSNVGLIAMQGASNSANYMAYLKSHMQTLVQHYPQNEETSILYGMNPVILRLYTTGMQMIGRKYERLFTTVQEGMIGYRQLVSLIGPQAIPKALGGMASTINSMEMEDFSCVEGQKNPRVSEDLRKFIWCTDWRKLQGISRGRARRDLLLADTIPEVHHQKPVLLPHTSFLRRPKVVPLRVPEIHPTNKQDGHPRRANHT